MKRIFALLLLASPIVPAVTGFAIGQEVKYITPEIPTEEEKIDALKLAYELNGNTMVRRPEHGIDRPVGAGQLLPAKGRSHHPADQKPPRQKDRAMMAEIYLGLGVVLVLVIVAFIKNEI